MAQDINNRNYYDPRLKDRLFALEEWISYRMECAADEGQAVRLLTLKRRYERIQDYAVAVFGFRL